MKEYKFVLGEENEIVCTSHIADDLVNDIKNAVKALSNFAKENGLTADDISGGIMYVPCEFYFDDEGSANYRGPSSDHPFYNLDRFTEAMEKFTADTLDERGMQNPGEAWVNVGGTYCCGPTWKKNPHYTGIPTAHPDSMVH